MIVEKYLKALATTRHRIIIPDLGAFLSKDGDGDLKNLIFSSFLKYNDGNLEKYIAEQEGISPEQSAEEVKKFSEEVNKTVKAKRQYSIDGFGYFYQDERGGTAFAVDAAAMPAVRPIKKEEPVPIVVPIPEEEKSIIIEEPVKPTATEPEVVVVSAPVQSVVQQPLAQTSTPVEPKVPVKMEPAYTPTPEEDEAYSRSGGINSLLLIIIILLLLIAGLIASYFIFDCVRSRVDSMLGIENKALVKSTEVPVVAPDTTHLIKPDITTTTPRPAVDGEIAVTPTIAGMYYVIAGTFMEYPNAVRLYRRAMNDGYQVEMMPKMGPLFPVAVYKTTDLKEADKMMREIKSKYGDAWVFKARR